MFVSLFRENPIHIFAKIVRETKQHLKKIFPQILFKETFAKIRLIKYIIKRFTERQNLKNRNLEKKECI